MPASRFFPLFFYSFCLFVCYFFSKRLSVCRCPDVPSIPAANMCKCQLGYLFLLPTSYAVSRANIIFHFQVDKSSKAMPATRKKKMMMMIAIGHHMQSEVEGVTQWKRAHHIYFIFIFIWICCVARGWFTISFAVVIMTFRDLFVVHTISYPCACLFPEFRPRFECIVDFQRLFFSPSHLLDVCVFVFWQMPRLLWQSLWNL